MQSTRYHFYLITALLIVSAVVFAVMVGAVLSHRRSISRGVSLVASARLMQVSHPRQLCVGFPFKCVVNEHDTFVGAAIGAPFRDLQAQSRALELKRRGVPLIGFCHYQNFPGSLKHNKFEDSFHYWNPLDYVSLMTAWGTCFRDPTEHGLTPDGPPIIDLVESDYSEPTQSILSKRTYDFAYVCLSDSWMSCDDGWQAYCRNWHRAKSILDLVCARGYRGILFGRSICASDDLPHHLRTGTTRTGMMRQKDFWSLLASSRCLFVPNQFDASPRVLAEAIQLEVGVCVNDRILGGWKYVDPSNGVTFDPDETDRAVAERLMGLIERQKRRPFSNRSFRERYGRLNTGERLARFINSLLGSSHRELYLKTTNSSI